jgi:hypothetical protein
MIPPRYRATKNKTEVLFFLKEPPNYQYMAVGVCQQKEATGWKAMLWWECNCVHAR